MSKITLDVNGKDVEFKIKFDKEQGFLHLVSDELTITFDGIDKIEKLFEKFGKGFSNPRFLGIIIEEDEMILEDVIVKKNFRELKRYFKEAEGIEIEEDDEKVELDGNRILFITEIYD